jgi:hypothetical protein
MNGRDARATAFALPTPRIEIAGGCGEMADRRQQEKYNIKTDVKNLFRFQFVAAAAVLLALAGAVHAGTIIAPQIVTNNASADITNAYTYTHAINLGGSGDPSVEINGVTFGVGGTSGTNWSITGFGWSVDAGILFTWWPSPADSVGSMISDFRYNAIDAANAAQSLTLTGLTPGQMYEARIYTRYWGTGGTDDRTNNIAFNEGGGLDTNVIFNADTVPEHGYYIGYTYTAGSSSNLVVTFARPNGANGNFHLSGFSNQVIPEPSTWALVGLGLMGTWLLRRRRR